MINPVLRLRCFMRIHRWRPIHLRGDVGRECRDCGERVFDKTDGLEMSPGEVAGKLGNMGGGFGG
jgi:hypothetical protein